MTQPVAETQAWNPGHDVSFTNECIHLMSVLSLELQTWCPQCCSRQEPSAVSRETEYIWIHNNNNEMDPVTFSQLFYSCCCQEMDNVVTTEPNTRLMIVHLHTISNRDTARKLGTQPREYPVQWLQSLSTTPALNGKCGLKLRHHPPGLHSRQHRKGYKNMTAWSV